MRRPLAMLTAGCSAIPGTQATAIPAAPEKVRMRKSSRVWGTGEAQRELRQGRRHLGIGVIVFQLGKKIHGGQGQAALAMRTELYKVTLWQSGRPAADGGGAGGAATRINAGSSRRASAAFRPDLILTPLAAQLVRLRHRPPTA